MGSELTHMNPGPSITQSLISFDYTLLAAAFNKIYQETFGPTVQAVLGEVLAHLQTTGQLVPPAVASMQAPPAPLVTTPFSVLSALRLFLNDPSAEFMSPEQSRAITLAIHQQVNFLCVLPTGGGKSMIFMLASAIDPSHRVTVVIVPYISLLNDLLRRSQEAGLSASRWEPGVPCDAKLVVVVTETAASRLFRSFLKNLTMQGKLARIVVDEVHLVLDQWKFRSAFQELRNVLSQSTQVILLTATLPPSHEHRLFTELGQYTPPLVIRTASTTRTSIRYGVEYVDDMDTEGVPALKKILARILHSDRPDDRVIVFCISRADAEMVAKSLQCHYYHGDMDSPTRATVYDEWVSGSGSPCIVATSALSSGVDNQDVAATIHFDFPRSAIDFSQESGRCARDGRFGESIILCARSAKPSIDLDDIGGRAPFAEVLREDHCFRVTLDHIIDGTGFPCYTNPMWTLCYSCLATSQSPVGQATSHRVNGYSMRSFNVQQMDNSVFLTTPQRQRLLPQSSLKPSPMLSNDSAYHAAPLRTHVKPPPLVQVKSEPPEDSGMEDTTRVEPSSQTSKGKGSALQVIDLTADSPSPPKK